MLSFNRIVSEIGKLWKASAPLTATGILMLAVFLPSAAGVFIDHRIITGAPAWLKPAKFAISTAIYGATIAWLFRYITVWPRFLRAVAWTLSLVLILEVALIDLQAARGTTSHFNAGTPLDLALFGIMGASIAILWLASIGVLIALFRQNFQDAAWGWSLRMGMLITVLGSAGGGLMLRMTTQQAEGLRVGQSLTTLGGHTVGAPDGGPGLPAVGWSTKHGDLRIPHFFGLHALQAVPLLGSLILRRNGTRADRNRTGVVFTITASYVALVAILTWQALRGQSILQPDAETLVAMAVWMAGTAMASVFCALRFRANLLGEILT